MTRLTDEQIDSVANIVRTMTGPANRADASRWVQVTAPVAGLIPIDGSKCKVQTCAVECEVDRYGQQVKS